MAKTDLIERGVGLAERGGSLAWDWARWAYESAGPIGEDGVRSGAVAKLTSDRNQVLSSLRGELRVPEVSALLSYRQAAEALPDRERENRISVGVARELYASGLGPVDRERALASFDGQPVTRAALRERIAEMGAADIPEPEPEPPEPEPAEPVDVGKQRAAPVPLAPAPKPSDPSLSVAEWKALTAQQRNTLLAHPGTGGFNQVDDNIGWARWSWNPITGCLHTCEYCYARDIANRFYPQGFEPTFRPHRIEQPSLTRMPAAATDNPEWRRVFVCSMADLFGKWVPKAWIDAVFDQIVAAPQWEFLCLTKFPQRLAMLDWPDNVWAGTTVDKQHRVDLAQRHFAEVKAGVRWLSCEPLLEPLKFDSLEMFDWVVIGACTASSGAREFAPPFEWVADLYQQARAAGCKVYLKHNLGMPFAAGARPGMEPTKEWPR